MFNNLSSVRLLLLIFWRSICRSIMDATAPLSTTESAAATRLISGHRRPLHTFGVSLIAIVHISFTKSKEIRLIGSVIKRGAGLARFAYPFVYAAEYLWVAILFYFDSYILAIESMVENLFPPSTRFLNRIDKVIQTVEILPEKLENAIDKFLMSVREGSVLEWALVQVISWLKFLIYSLTYVESDNAREKEIVIDVSYSEVNPESSLGDNALDPVESPRKSETVEKFSPISDTSQAEAGTPSLPDAMKCSHKEVLEKGTKEDTEEKEEDIEEKEEKIIEEVTEENEAREVDKSDEGSTMDDDRILRLFESSWHMTPP
ncbi:uncharacterized protein LOC131144724 [Malania oleifera]|uniref:uncharacterized protein LOC131144724 n=1 Tax=Malania oleifera TaxID=397392 RepID=UPI0025AE11D0|nr:uncharacterized protein LOC131144724 [Malania oleifera]